MEMSYKMADVKCDICGDKGHATIDCTSKCSNNGSLRRCRY